MSCCVQISKDKVKYNYEKLLTWNYRGIKKTVKLEQKLLGSNCWISIKDGEERTETVAETVAVAVAFFFFTYPFLR